MKARIFKNMLVLCLVCVFITTFLIVTLLYRQYSDTMLQKLHNEAKYLVLALNDAQDPAFKLASLGQSNDQTRLTLVASDGTVLYDSAAQADTMENHLNRPEIMTALSYGYGQSQRLSATLNEKTTYYAVRLLEGSVIRLSYTQQSIIGILMSMITMFLVIIVAAMLVCSIVARRMTNSIVRPINELNLDDVQSNRVYDELAPLIVRLEKQNQKISAQIQELEKGQEDLLAITENMSEGLVVINTEAQVLSINHSAQELFQVERADCIGKHILVLNRSLELQHAAQIACQGQPNEQVISIAERHYQIYASPVKQDGNVTGAILFILDITKEYESEHMRREFSANVSHELRTPLTSISGYAEIMKSGIVKPEDMSAFAGRIHDECARLMTLIDDIMQLSRLDEGNRNLYMEQVPLLEVCQQVKKRLLPQAENKHVAIAVSGEPVNVLANKQLIQEMVYNLCDNAIKYNRESGWVKMTVSTDEEHVILTVQDNGEGIPPEDQSRVFERFYRVNKSRSKQVGGTGLGLSVVKHGAQYHNATVHLESTLNQGTTIRILFS